MSYPERIKPPPMRPRPADMPERPKAPPSQPTLNQPPPTPPDDPPGYMEMTTGWGMDFQWPRLTYKRWSAIWSGVGLALAIKQLVGG
jgi:hypothetical protein